MKLKVIGLVASMLMLVSVTALAAPPAAFCRFIPAETAASHPHCVGENNPEPTPNPTTTTTTQAPTTTAAPVTTTTPTTTAPTNDVESPTPTDPEPTPIVVDPEPTTTTTAPEPTTTTTTAPASNVSNETIWTGNRVSDWYSVANSGDGDQRDTTVNGQPAVEQMLPSIDGSNNHGARLNFQGFDDPNSDNPTAHSGSRVLPTEAVYSVTMLVPEYAGAQNNVFQFKQGNGSTRQHLWNIGWVPENGQLRGIIRTRLSGDEWGTLQELARLDWYVPIGEPFTVEVFRRISTGNDGRYEVRIDGQLLYTFDGPTAASNLEPRSSGNHEWVLSHYLGRGYNMDGDVGPSSVYFYNARITR